MYFVMMVEGQGTKTHSPADAGATARDANDSAESPKRTAIAGSTAEAAEPWQKTTIGILISYLAFHLLLLMFLTLYPLITPLLAEGFLGPVYHDLMTIDLQKIGIWIVAALSGAMSVASLWGAEMNIKRRWLLRLSLTGIVFSALFYVTFIWMDGGVNLWEYDSYPNSDEFKVLAGQFSLRNFAVFAAALFGALGVKLPGWLGIGKP